MNIDVRDGNVALIIAAQKYAIDLSVLVAETGPWADPQIHSQFVERNGTGALYPNIRRYRAGEKEGMIIDGIKLDSNV